MTQKKCPIRILISNLFWKSDFTFPHVFWNQNFEPVSSSHVILPIENHKCPKNAKNACADALLGLFSGQFSSKGITFASLLQVTSICVYNTVRPPQQRQGTPPVQEVKWKLIDLKFSSPEKWLISCKPCHLLIKTQLQLEHGLRAGGKEARLEDSPDTK